MDDSISNTLLVGISGAGILYLGTKLWRILRKKSKSTFKKTICFEIG